MDTPQDPNTNQVLARDGDTSDALGHTGFNLVSRPTQDHLVLYNEKLNEVRELLGKTKDDILKCLTMIDTLQNLGIDYHFQEEIQSFLSSHYESLVSGGGDTAASSCNNSLYMVSLSFRLLRQNGYPLTADVFNGFFDNDGKFHEKLAMDLKGMLQLHQASHYEIEGEDILEKEKSFTGKFLRNSFPILNKLEANVVKDMLENPREWTLPRFNIKKFLENYDMQQESYGILFQELAKMDFNVVQSLHKTELQQVLTWWRVLDLATKVNFARDQPVKWYVWSMGILTDPKYSEERINFTKPISFVYLMDDIFDVYGVLEELVVFTEAINEWQVNEDLSHPMKMFLKALYDTTDEISHNVLEKYGWNPIISLKKAWMRLCNAFLVEAKWFASGYLPTSDEYLKNGMISTGVHLVFVHIFFLLGDNINMETVDLIDNVPALISCTAILQRLWNDLGGFKYKNQQGHDGSYINCYMKEHQNLTAESAQEHVFDTISDTWKKLNKECISPNYFPSSLKKASLNAARMAGFMHNYNEIKGCQSLRSM